MKVRKTYHSKVNNFNTLTTTCKIELLKKSQNFKKSTIYLEELNNEL